MRILVVPKWYPWPDRPVFGIFCQEQARALARAHHVVVLASDPVRRPGFLVFEVSEAVEDGIRTFRVRYRRPAFRPAAMACELIGMASAALRLRRSGWRPEIVHAHVYSAGLPALIVGRLSRAPVVISEHFTGFQRGLIRGYDRFVARFAFRHADLVAPVSEELAEQVRAVQPRARIRVIGNVVDTDVFHPAIGAWEAQDGADPQGATSDALPRLLTVAALAEKKGLTDLLDAVAELRRTRKLTLDLVGEGDQRRLLEERVRRLGVSEDVRLHGELGKREVAELMRQADLFVLPSLFENLPCVLLEAMASGLPFVATRVGGVPGLVRGEYGILTEPGDPVALTAAIAEALGRLERFDRDAALNRLERFDRQRAVDEARARFGYEAFVRTWTAVYRALRGGAPLPLGELAGEGADESRVVA